MESQKPTPTPHPKSDKKPPQQSGNFVWYFLGLGVLLLLMVTIFNSRNEPRIRMSDFIHLVKASNPQTHPDKSERYIDVEDRSNPQQQRWIRLSDLSHIVIGDTEVKATVTSGKLNSTAAELDGVKPAAGASVDGKEENVPLRVNLNNDEDEVRKLLQANNLDFENYQQPSPLMNWIPALLMTGLLVMLFIFMMRRMGGAGSPMAFGRSRGKLIAQEDVEVTFEDVAGIEEAVDELREVVEFLKTPEKYQRLGGRIPKGVLLVGPPGTGKTLLAKAVAGEASVPFFSLSGSDFVEMFVGVGAARVRDLFEQGRRAAKVSGKGSIIFIDEIDAVGRLRFSGIGGGHDEREQTLNALLVEMDGFDTQEGLILIAATNRPDTLDPALLRPGRFDRHIVVNLADIVGREEILKIHTKKIKL